MLIPSLSFPPFLLSSPKTLHKARYNLKIMGQCNCTSIKKKSKPSIKTKESENSFYEIIKYQNNSPQPIIIESLKSEPSAISGNPFPNPMQESTSPLNLSQSQSSSRKYNARSKVRSKTWLDPIRNDRKKQLKTGRFSNFCIETMKNMKEKEDNQGKSLDSPQEPESSIIKFEENEVFKNFFISESKKITREGTFKSKRLTGFYNAEFIMKELLNSPMNSPKMAKEPKPRDQPLSRQRSETRKSSMASLCSHDLENISLTSILNQNETSNSILIFSVPFKKHFNSTVNYNFQSFNTLNFTSFYKTSEIKTELIQKPHNYYSHVLALFPCRWETLIPYQIDKELFFLSNSSNSSMYNVIMESLHEIQEKTVVKFVSYSKLKHESFINFILGTKNSALIGRHKGNNTITLKKNAKKADILHQVMHCLGFMHMHYKSHNEFFSYLSKEQVKSSNFLPEDRHMCLFGVEFGPLDFNSVLYCGSCVNMISFIDRDDLDSICLSLVDCAKINFFYDERKIELSDEEVKREIERMEMGAKGFHHKLRLSLRIN